MNLLNIELIKELRRRTGLSLSICRESLLKNGNNLSKSLDWLKVNGIYGVSNKQNRQTREGVISSFQTDDKITLVDIRTETDFVSKNSRFLDLAKQIAQAAHQIEHEDPKMLLSNTNIHGSKVSDLIEENIAIVGENIRVQRIKHIASQGGRFSVYVHNKVNSHSGKIISVLSFDSLRSERSQKLSKEIAMHIAASRPLFLNRQSVDDELIEKETSLLYDQAVKEKKPQVVIERMIKGRMNKFYESIVLLDQIFAVDGKTKISHLVENIYSDCNFKIYDFVRMEAGEDL